ncbi:glucuronyl esterase domain-containing protein [Sorangium sp. So ce1335]|uniref:glucuronyl esterase domain-containing protein n=1 Tax=Sorangium sp. So ce1335 TaxID=3133335 RepID=UPI003F5D6746
MFAALPVALAACGTGDGSDSSGSGGGGSSAVSTGVDGSGSGTGSGTGGAPTGTGGASSSGGTPTGTGGDLATSVGSTGGGGPVGTGGATGTGGADGSGGGGGNAASAEWGEVENPGAGCSVGPMPSVGSLTANAKLPDPFKKMDGTRISDRSQWACRREEILQQAYEFIYGDKPVPAEGAVSGTVSESRITVEVNDGGGSASFNLTVNMNGATAPAPAIIGYGGLSGMPVPRGVATITFTAVESTGGSGGKNGPFYSVYGSNHPAGYLTAQAWQISRVLDVLEQNPGVIDPRRVGVTGCSRWGKGAFVAGALDNRIALTIPVESGLGGTVGLRLVEVLDSYSGAEWPYHGISYVRWLSETALGQFTTGNNAGADNTNKLPVDMHEMMGLIAPRGLYIVDNPSTMYNGLDRNSAWVTANVGKMIFEALGVGDHMAYTGAGGAHCSWRSQYTASLNAMIDKFLKGNDAAETGNFATDLPNRPNHMDHIDWTPPTLAGEL